MLPHRKVGLAAVTATAALMATAGSAAAHLRSHDYGRTASAGAVFVQTDNTAGEDTIAVYDRNPGGTLTAAGTYKTGGNGESQPGSTADYLASQDSLVYDAATSELFAVNAGSNTVSVFAVNGDRLHLRQVIGSGGSFPSSIAVHDDLVYVLNAFGGGVIQGYRLDGGALAPISGSSRALNTTPNPPTFTTTPGDIAFSPSGRDLLITTKGGSNAIDVFTVGQSGQPSANPVITSLPGTTPFALAFEGSDQVDVGEAAGYVASFALGRDGTLTPLDSVATNQAATCWIVADGPWLFAGNAGSGTESSVLSSPSGALTLSPTPTSTDPGTIDAATSPGGRYLYVQTGGKDIVDEFQVGPGGSLSEIGWVTFPGTAGGEGIATS